MEALICLYAVPFLLYSHAAYMESQLQPILNLDLYGEHMPEEIITGSKSDLDLSAGSTYM